MTSSAIGWMLMSQLKDRDVESQIRRSNLAEGKPTSENFRKTLACVQKARGDGHSYAENMPFLGGATICVPLPVLVQGQTVALGRGSILERMRQNYDHHLAVLQNSALLLDS
jgi:DNA-binding IclR family transcriptional regulator